MAAKLEVVAQMFHGFKYKRYFTANTGEKLSLILAAEEHILGLENGAKRFTDEVTALSQAFAIAIPHEKAMAVKDEVAFFQAVKARLVKFEHLGAGKTGEALETAIRQIIDKALVAENDSAKQVMGKDKLRELAVVLYERVRENASIDWTIKESVRAKLKVIVKRLLRQYGYPPDMELLATETVLKQAELIAEELVAG